MKHAKTLGIIGMLAAALIALAPQAMAVTYQGGKFDVVVAIDPEMAEDLPFIDSIKNMMKDASQYMHTSLNEQAMFGTVTILVPDTWTNATGVVASEGETVAGADIFVGKNVACGACASAGRIQIDDGSMVGKTVVHEWGHYYFNLGDEYCDYVFKNSAWYQVYKTDAGWNRCTALQNIERSCEERAPGAACNITTNVVNGAKASIMHRQANTGITSWCDNGTDAKYKHNKDVNNHQNRIHNKKSCWEVIENHGEGFKQSPSAGDKVTYAEPTFVLKQAGKADVVLVIDVSGSMSGSRMANTAAAAKNFVDRAEKGTYIGVVSFHTTASQRLALTKVDFPDAANPTATDTRPTIKAAIPTTTADMTSIGAGMQTALNMLNASTHGLAKVMALLTDGGENTAPYVSTVLPSVVAGNVKVFSVGLGAASDAVLQDIATQTGGEYYYALDNDPQALSDAFTSIGNKVTSVQVNTLTSKQGVIAAGATQTFEALIDDTVGENTVFSFSFSNGTAANMTVTLEQPGGAVLDNTYAGYIQDNTSQIILYDIDGTADAGTWTATVTNNNASGVTTNLMVTSSNSPGEAAVTLGASLNAASVVYPDTIRIEANLFSSDAIIYANVWAEVSNPSGITSTVTLHDDGQGADLFQLDGIYSGYFTNYTGDGRYSVKVFADNANGAAEEGAQFNDATGYQSDTDYVIAREGDILYADDTLQLARLMTNGGLRKDVFDFQRVLSAGGFELAGWVGVDQIPPSRITTLAATKVQGQSVVLNWIATGDDADTGQADSYDLRYSKTMIENDADFDAATQVPGLAPPQISGSEETYTVLGLTKGAYYFAIKAEDGDGNKSDISNVYQVPVNVAEDEVTNPPYKTKKEFDCFIRQVTAR